MNQPVLYKTNQLKGGKVIVSSVSVQSLTSNPDPSVVSENIIFETIIIDNFVPGDKIEERCVSYFFVSPFFKSISTLK